MANKLSSIHDKMTLKAFRQIALILLILCIISPTHSHYHERGRDRDRKRIKATGNGPSSLASQQPQIATKITTINLCSKERDMKLVCHCTPDDVSLSLSFLSHQQIFIAFFTVLVFLELFLLHFQYTVTGKIFPFHCEIVKKILFIFY